VGGQCHTLASFLPSNEITERDSTGMDTVSWALAAILMDRQKGTSFG